MKKQTLKRILIGGLISAELLSNSGCGAVLIYGMMEVTGANKYYDAVEKAERERGAREDGMEKRLAKLSPDVGYREKVYKETISETSRRLGGYSKEETSLSDLERTLYALRSEIIIPNKRVKEDYEKAKILYGLYHDVKRLRSLRNSFGDYIEVYSGMYYTAHGDNIRRSVSELRSMKGKLMPYKDEPNVSEVLKEVRETLGVAEEYADRHPDAQTLRRVKSKERLQAIRKEKDQRKVDWWKRQYDRAEGFKAKRKIREEAKLCGVSI